MHPADGLVGIFDQDAGEHRVRPTRRHAPQVRQEILLGVRLHVVEEARQPRLDVRQQGLQGARHPVRDPQQPATEPGVAAPLGLGRLFEHEHPIGPFLAGGVGGGERGVSRSHHDYVEIAHCNPFRESSCIRNSTRYGNRSALNRDLPLRFAVRRIHGAGDLVRAPRQDEDRADPRASCTRQPQGEEARAAAPSHNEQSQAWDVPEIPLQRAAWQSIGQESPPRAAASFSIPRTMLNPARSRPRSSPPTPEKADRHRGRPLATSSTMRPVNVCSVEPGLIQLFY